MIEIIPDRNSIERDLELCRQYGLSFEYDDFMFPEMLDDEKRVQETIDFYLSLGRDLSNDTLHGVFLDITPHSSDRLIKEASLYRMRQSMQIAEKLGVRAVIFHTNTIPNFHDKTYLAGWLKANTETYRTLLAEFKNTMIFVENMFDQRPDEILALAEAMKDEPRFGICLDYAHASCFSSDASGWLRLLAPYVRHMHINDNDLRDDLHLALGEGEIAWDEYFRMLSSLDIDPSVLIEVTGQSAKETSLSFLFERSLESC